MKIYCSGIGGIGISAYAALQNANGHTVLGSDRGLTVLTEDLNAQGIEVFANQDGTHVPADADLFVYSEAIPEDAPERVKASEYGIKQLSYFAALGELSREYTVIAVCGTHGKSTTTAMAAGVLIDAGLDPSIIVGTKVPQLSGRNWRKGDSNLFLLEACEYRRSFLHLHPDIIVMTNVDGDHFDAFDSVEDYQNAYREFLERLPEDGIVITHMGDADCRRVAEMQNAKCKMQNADTYSLPELSVPGRHMQENAQLVTALAQHLNIESAQSLKSFSGTWRRFELKGYYQPPTTNYQLPIIDDYAHHPIEIKATIASTREKYSDKRIVCFFQPHMHDRTLRFYDEFLSAFDGADLLVLSDPYDARPDVEKDMVDMPKFARDIHIETVYAGSLAEAKQRLCSKILQQSDVLVVMGAGDVTNVAEELVS